MRQLTSLNARKLLDFSLPRMEKAGGQFPIGMILGIVAGIQGAPKWLICVVEIASLPLLVVGIMAGAAV
jgi:hypothetical protein